MKIPKIKLLKKDKDKEKADNNKVENKKKPKSATSSQKTAKDTTKKEKSKLKLLKKEKEGEVYKSVKTRNNRPFFNKTFGASARADFEVDKFRYYFVWGIACVLFLVLFARATYIQVINSEFYQKKFEHLNTSEREIPTHRGMIFDRNNQPLAIDAPLTSVIFNPYEYAKSYYEVKKQLAQEAKKEEPSAKRQAKLQKKLAKLSLTQVAKTTKISVKKLKQLANIKEDQLISANEDIEKLLPTGKGSKYFPLMRKVPPEQAEKVLELKIAGIYKEDFDKRFYPQSYPNSQLLGFMGQSKNDPSGQYKGRTGLELKYEDKLAGKKGSVLMLRDGRRVGLKEIKQIKAEKPGEDLHLTIDSRLQYLLYQELEKVGREQEAFWASGIVVDVKTGEVLAMSAWPSYNANDLNELTGENQRNRPISDNFEPGSVMKPFTVVAALQSGKFNEHSVIETSPGQIRIGDYTIKDHEDLGKINLTELLQHSSNVGSTKIALSLPADAIPKVQREFGFGEKTSLDLPGEQKGIIKTPRQREKARRATMSYGYGLQVTLAQLAQAYATLGAGGVKHPLHIVKTDKQLEETQIIPKEQALSVVKMMESVTQRDGTAPKASIDGYRVAGKTGTSRRISPDGGYYEDKYRTTFVGIAPVSNPRYAIAILVENPQHNIYAGDVSAPVFRNVMKEVLRLYNVPLDKPLKMK
ncbi:MAG: penicillin-binding protein 2 [Moraxellaceae bacterium]|nr:penicillin-binding protein 2 [Moraxellaceae bacterium]